MKTNRKQEHVLFVCARLINAALLIWAYARDGYIFHESVKLIACGVALYGVYYTYKLKMKTWKVVFAVIAILFNPFLPVHLSRQAWEVYDLAAAGVLLLSVFLLKSANKDLKEA
jgi:hypothetical protein